MNEITADLSGAHVRVTGDDRVRFLQGMCTTNVESLAEGAAAHACMLTPKGRVVDVFRVVRRPDDLVLLAQPGRAAGLAERLSGYAIMDDVELEVEDIAAHAVWPTPAAVWDATPVFAAPAAPSPADAVEVRRVEAGYPLAGVDTGEDYFPFESLLGRYVDYEKGCYIGQEPVSRVHFRGQAARMMRGLRLDGDAPVDRGATVAHADRASAGTVTSSVISPAFGPIALAYVHRSVNEPGTKVTVTGREATLVELPFSSP